MVGGIIFTNFSGKTAQNIGSCQAKDGKCAFEFIEGKCGRDSSGNNYPVPIIVSGECEQSKPKGLCCLSIGEKNEK